MFKQLVMLTLCIVLVGCGSIKKQWTDFTPDRDGAYLEATSVPPVAMPAGMAMNKAYLSDPYPLPKGKLPPKGAKPIDIFPPTLKKEFADDDEADDTDAS